MALMLVPVSLDEANQFVREHGPTNALPPRKGDEMSCSICKNTRMKTLTHSAVRCVLKRYQWRLPDNVDKRGVRKWHLGRYYGYGTSLSWIPLNKFGGIATKPFDKHDVIFPKKIDRALRLIVARAALTRAAGAPAT